MTVALKFPISCGSRLTCCGYVVLRRVSNGGREYSIEPSVIDNVSLPVVVTSLGWSLDVLLACTLAGNRTPMP